ncbi:hypothetical protein [Paenibacillus sp. sgz500992]|uniref:hypothetical protein n=1 Tax=Paenibacillus sp. sgz500992 TaxID=3242476 RepID=UPI0036D4394A
MDIKKQRRYYVNRQADGSIDIMDIFHSLTTNQLEFCVSYLEKQPLFEDNKLNKELYRLN